MKFTSDIYPWSYFQLWPHMPIISVLFLTNTQPWKGVSFEISWKLGLFFLIPWIIFKPPGEKKRHFLLIIILRLCMKLSETGMEINQKIYLHSLLTLDILKVITVQVIAQRDSYRTLITCMKSQYMANVRDQNQTMTGFIPKNIRSQVLHLKNSLISESGYAYLIDRFR